MRNKEAEVTRLKGTITDDFCRKASCKYEK